MTTASKLPMYIDRRLQGVHRTGTVFIGVAAFLVAGAVQASDVHGMYFEGGSTFRGGVNADLVGVGLITSWDQVGAGASPNLYFAWDLFIDQWRAPESADGRRNYAQLGAIATWRYRPRTVAGWFVDTGIGVTVSDHVYRTQGGRFSTAFQFTEVLAVGRTWGVLDEHEISARLQHVSNGSIKRPNPGANFWRVRYLRRF